jgi:hypothetical protein
MAMVTTRRMARWAAVGVALAGCSEPVRFVADAGGGGGGLDVGPVVRDTGVVPMVDTGVATDRGSVRTVRDFLLPGTVDDAPTRFGGAETEEGAPTLVYPDDRTIIPPNLPLFEVHFRPGAGNDLFAVSFAGDVSEARFFTRCSRVNDGCVLTLNAGQMTEIARASAGSSGVRITVRGTAVGESGGAVRRSASRFLGVTQTELRGGVYWWVSSGSIARYDFGRADARAESFLRGDPINCVGCHALSRDGQRIAAGRFIPAPAPTSILNVQTRARIGNEFGNNFGTFSPDNTRFLASDGMRMTLLDATTAMPTMGLAAGTAGSMPDWSPNGNAVVFSRPRQMVPIPTGSPGHGAPADLFLMDWNGSAFGAPRMLAQSMGQNFYYPSYSPDGQWIVFNVSSGNSYDAPDASLYVVRADGTGQPVRLTSADGAVLGNSWPKWTPFVERYVGELEEPLMWVTFTSRRDYGLRIQQQNRERGQQRAQLWMAAFRPGVSGADPSAPGFWVPFQNLNEGNHIAQWVEEIRRQDCGDAGTCGPGEICQNGRCIGPPP